MCTGHLTLSVECCNAMPTFADNFNFKALQTHAVDHFTTFCCRCTLADPYGTIGLAPLCQGRRHLLQLLQLLLLLLWLLLHKAALQTALKERNAPKLTVPVVTSHFYFGLQPHEVVGVAGSKKAQLHLLTTLQLDCSSAALHCYTAALLQAQQGYSKGHSCCPDDTTKSADVMLMRYCV